MMLQEQPAGGEGSAHRRSREVVQTKVSARAKALGLEGAQLLREPARRPGRS